MYNVSTRRTTAVYTKLDAELVEVVDLLLAAAPPEYRMSRTLWINYCLSEMLEELEQAVIDNDTPVGQLYKENALECVAKFEIPPRVEFRKLYIDKNKKYLDI